MLTVSHIGKVAARATAIKANAARNLPTTASVVVSGKVSISSMVPVLRSSAHSRIDTAGISNR